MVDGNSVGSPLEAAADVSGERVTEAFSLLGNEARLAVLLALWEAYEPFPGGTWDPTEGNAVSFSDLRRRVGIRDSGQFNYHLDKLEGHFVERSSDGYQLLPAGQKLVRTVIASAGFEEPTLEPSEIDLACPHCDAPTAVTYQNQRVYQICTACDGSFELREKHPSSVLSAFIADPNILRERAPEAVYETIQTTAYHDFAMRIGEICPQCSGRIDARLDVCENHDPGDGQPCPACDRQPMAVVRFVCTACKHTSASNIVGVGYAHPAMGAFAWTHDIELGYGRRSLETARWLLDVEHEQALVATGPPRVRVTYRYEGDELELTYDESLNVVEANENY